MNCHKLIRITFVLINVYLIISFTVACGNKLTTKTQDNINSKKRIVFWNLYYNTQNKSDKNTDRENLFIYKAIEKFEEKNPNITVDVLSPSIDNYYNLFKTSCHAGNGPDVAMLWTGGYTHEYEKYILPLNRYYSEQEIRQLTGWELSRMGFTDNEFIRAVPVGKTGVMCMYYNKAKLRKAGFNTEIKPANWEELLVICRKLKDKNIQPFVMGEREGYNSAWVLGQLWIDLEGLDNLLRIRDGKKKFSDDNGLKEAFRLWSMLFQLGYTNEDVISISQEEGQARFLKGEAAMEIGSSWIAKDVYSCLGEDAGWFPYPHARPDAPFVNTYCGGFSGYNFIVTNFSRHPDEAVYFIKYMTSSQVQDWCVEESQWEFSNNVGSKEPILENNPILKEMYNFMKTTSLHPVPAWDNILQIDLCYEMYKISSLVFGGKITVEEALFKLDGSYKSIIGSQ